MFYVIDNNNRTAYKTEDHERAVDVREGVTLLHGISANVVHKDNLTPDQVEAVKAYDDMLANTTAGYKCVQPPGKRDILIKRERLFRVKLLDQLMTLIRASKNLDSDIVATILNTEWLNEQCLYAKVYAHGEVIHLEMTDGVVYHLILKKVHKSQK